MRTHQRKFVAILLILIAILIVVNIISTPTINDNTESPISVFAESTHEIEQLTQEIDKLKAMHHSHTSQISTLSNTILDLNEQIETLKQQQSQSQTHDHNPPHEFHHRHAIERHSDESAPNKADNPKVIKQSVSFSGSFELIPENEIIYPQITVSNADVDDTPTSPNSNIVKDMNNDHVIYDNDRLVIHGNPLLLDECASVLTADHELNILSSISFYHNSFVPWFWSRESIGSVLQNQPFNMPSHILASDAFDNVTNAIYIEIVSSASHMMHNALLKSTNPLQEIQAKPNARIQSECGFTFVQHPITRFVAAYFSVNVFLWKQSGETGDVQSLSEEITFYKIVGDLKLRFKAFINDLRKYHYAFLWSFAEIMNALITQSGSLSFSQNDIHHIFKYESLQKEYGNILADPNDEFCVDRSDHFVFNKDIEEDDWDDLLLDFGIKKEDLMDKEFREWMGLKVTLNQEYNYKDVEDLVRMDMLYVYDAMDYELYSKVVEYYWQDFVCFDYAPDYRHDVLDHLSAFQEEYPGFRVINRTETNWDKIVEYYYSKKYKQRRW